MVSWLTNSRKKSLTQQLMSSDWYKGTDCLPISDPRRFNDRWILSSEGCCPMLCRCQGSSGLYWLFSSALYFGECSNCSEPSYLFYRSTFLYSHDFIEVSLIEFSEPNSVTHIYFGTGSNPRRTLIRMVDWIFDSCLILTVLRLIWGFQGFVLSLQDVFQPVSYLMPNCNVWYVLSSIVISSLDKTTVIFPCFLYFSLVPATVSLISLGYLLCNSLTLHYQTWCNSLIRN